MTDAQDGPSGVCVPKARVFPPLPHEQCCLTHQATQPEAANGRQWVCVSLAERRRQTLTHTDKQSTLKRDSLSRRKGNSWADNMASTRAALKKYNAARGALALRNNSATGEKSCPLCLCPFRVGFLSGCQSLSLASSSERSRLVCKLQTADCSREMGTKLHTIAIARQHNTLAHTFLA